VPLFINAIPVPMAQDAYPIAIMTSFLLHQYFPILRDVVKISPYLKTAFIVLYETMRAAVVCKLTYAAGNAIAPTEFSIPIFGPIFCGTIAGCGGAFLPLNKGLDPIKMAGPAQPMVSAFIAATFFHLFLHTSLSDGIVNAKEKAHICVTTFFIIYNLQTTFMADDHYPVKLVPKVAPKVVESPSNSVPKLSESDTEKEESPSKKKKKNKTEDKKDQ